MYDIEKAQAAVAQLLQAFGVDEGDHTADTPSRVARSWSEHLSGYAEDPADHLGKTFSAPPDAGIVMVGGLRFVSTCAHHLERIVGVATVAYRPHPGQPVVGLSKLSRVLTGYARRLQVQEQLGWQVAAAVQQRLEPIGAACIITSAHGCMSLRGVQQPASVTTTHSWRGMWKLNETHPDRAAVLEEHTRSVSGFKGGAVW